MIDCTKDRPWDKQSDEGGVRHVDAYESGECSQGCCAYYTCPNCGHKWKQELGQ